MSPVGDAGQHGGSGLKLGAAFAAGVVVMFPFVLVAGVFWGWWWSDETATAGGWVTMLFGVAAAVSLGGWVATNDG
ncbi:hypothetical protein EV193_101161 [Herbihabitans rhizosphaerae]|uniref:Uncharacterized protein n=2 Tax=Herbihabitans rhizosphaerae TaxID=1872711 RepID=A0A4Q7L4Z6_9PSEU|nr:hypothetical protein EV193_101161 [Herbihabitans rhizosphaerae]